METKFTLRARWVAPIDQPPIADGQVSIADGVIVEVGRNVQQVGPTEDLGDVVLLPGLVNAHTHLEFSDLQHPLGQPGIALPEWIRAVIAQRGRRDRDPGDAVRVGLIESLTHGVTTIGDIATVAASAYAAEHLPNLVLFHEAIGFSAGRVASVADDLEQRVARTTPDAAVVGVSPHSPYTVHPELLDRLVATAAARKLPVAMHLAETPEELQLLAHGTGPFQKLLAERSMWDADAIPRGSTPLDYLRTLSHAPRSLVIHGNYLSSSEIDFLGQQRSKMSVAYCPRTHAYFRHECYPLREMLNAGVRVVLGTDSRASNPDLSLLAEMQFVAELHPNISPEQIVRMGTADGAAALGSNDCRGRLAPQMSADLIAVRAVGHDDPYLAILAPEATTQAAWLHGRRVRR